MYSSPYWTCGLSTRKSSISILSSVRSTPGAIALLRLRFLPLWTERFQKWAHLLWSPRWLARTLALHDGVCENAGGLCETPHHQGWMYTNRSPRPSGCHHGGAPSPPKHTQTRSHTTAFVGGRGPVALNGPLFLDRECSKTKERRDNPPSRNETMESNNDRKCRGRSSSSRPWVSCQKKKHPSNPEPCSCGSTLLIDRPHVLASPDDMRRRQET